MPPGGESRTKLLAIEQTKANSPCCMRIGPIEPEILNKEEITLCSSAAWQRAPELKFLWWRLGAN